MLVLVPVLVLLVQCLLCRHDVPWVASSLGYFSATGLILVPCVGIGLIVRGKLAVRWRAPASIGAALMISSAAAFCVEGLWSICVSISLMGFGPSPELRALLLAPQLALGLAALGFIVGCAVAVAGFFARPGPGTRPPNAAETNREEPTPCG